MAPEPGLLRLFGGPIPGPVPRLSLSLLTAAPPRAPTPADAVPDCHAKVAADYRQAKSSRPKTHAKELQLAKSLTHSSKKKPQNHPLALIRAWVGLLCWRPTSARDGRGTGLGMAHWRAPAQQSRPSARQMLITINLLKNTHINTDQQNRQ